MQLLIFLWGCGDKENLGELDTAPGDTGTVLPDCGTISADECGDHTRCLGISAHLLEVDDVNTCYELGEQYVVGCMDIETGCGSAITFASDLSGTSYMFSSTCIPEGWTEQADLNTYSEGCPQESTDCYSLSVSECGGVDTCTYISLWFGT